MNYFQLLVVVIASQPKGAFDICDEASMYSKS